MYIVLLFRTYLSLRVTAQISSFPSHYSHIRRSAAFSVIAFHFYEFAERFPPYLRRVPTLSAVHCFAFSLNRISLLSDQTLHYLLFRTVRRGLNRTPRHGRVSLVFVLSISFLCVDSTAASFEILFVLFLIDRLHNEHRNRSHCSHSVDFLSRILKVESVAGTSWYWPQYTAAGAIHL